MYVARSACNEPPTAELHTHFVAGVDFQQFAAFNTGGLVEFFWDNASDTEAGREVLWVARGRLGCRDAQEHDRLSAKGRAAGATQHSYSYPNKASRHRDATWPKPASCRGLWTD